MPFLNEYLPILIYILLCVLIILLIVICIKVIKTMNKVEAIVLDVDKKVKSLNAVFNIFDALTDKLSILTEAFADYVMLFVKSIFKKKKLKKEEENEDE